MNRLHVPLFFGSSLALVVAGYACSSSSSGNAGPPLNEAGSDTTSSGSSGSSSGAGSSSGTGSSSGGTGSSSGGTNNGCGVPDGGTPPLCSSLPGTVLYIQSGDTQETVLDVLGREMRDSANIVLAFQLTGSCTLTPNVYKNTPLPVNSQMLYIPSASECPSWKNGDPELTCTTSASQTTPIDVGISALFPSSCKSAGATPAGIKLFNGPIQAYTFVVPPMEFSGGQNSITAEEAYYAFGDGINNPVLWNSQSEWNMPQFFYLRPATKSTLVSTAYNIGLTPAQMTLATADGGTSDGRQLLASSDDVVNGVAAATSNQAIGILGSEVYDQNRSKLNVLAFSGFGQSAQYYPDSTTTAFDKENLRNGNYTLWSPAVLEAPVDGSGNPTNPTAGYFIDAFLGTPNATPPNGFIDGGEAIDGLAATIVAGLTPDCAMQVNRPNSIDGEPVQPYTPTAPCTCYYLANVPNAGTLPASCTTCMQNSDCTGTGAVGCFHGYCETNPPPSVTPMAATKTGVVYPGDGGLEPLNP
jgi:hypothetical protein